MEKGKFIRVGVDYFKIIEVEDRFGIIRTKLKKWNRQELQQDKGTTYMKNEVPKYDDFILKPVNVNYSREVLGCYNIYHPFVHIPDSPITGEPYKGIYWTHVLMREIFGEQYKLGFQYLKVLYERPTQALPVLVLVSKERQTGKSTFLDWLNAVFGNNMAMINPESIGSQFNGEYAGANIVGIDETIIERKSAVEKIKSLATSKFLTMNMKYVEPIKVPFFGKIIMATNNETDFMRIDREEIRFWVRKLSTPKIKNHKILDDCVSEIPQFLYYLENMPPIDYTRDSRMVFTDKDLHNKYLDDVKEASRSSLHKELSELFRDWFSNNSDFYLKVIPKDIKERWFDHNNQITINYIRKVLREEFNLTTNKQEQYKPFEHVEWRNGRPFTLTRNMFLTDEEDTEEGGVPF